MNIPTISHPTDRPNLTVVYVDGIAYGFSYETCIAFNAYDAHGWIVSENLWGPTTGKHCNYFSHNRIPRSEFEARLAAVSSNPR